MNFEFRKVKLDDPKESLPPARVTSQLAARSSDSRKSAIEAVAVSPVVGLGGTVMLASSSCNDVKLWSVTPDGVGVCSATLTGHIHKIMALAFGPRAIYGDVIILVSGGGCSSADSTKSLKVWGIRPDSTYSRLASLDDWHAKPVTALFFNPLVFEDGSMQFFSGGWDGCLCTGTVRRDGSVILANKQEFQFAVQCIACSARFDASKSAFLAVGFSGVSSQLTSIPCSSRVIIWKSQPSLDRLCDYIHVDVYSIAFSDAFVANGRPVFLLATGCKSGIIKISAVCPDVPGSPFNFSPLTYFKAHSSFVWGLKFRPASSSREILQLASCSGSYTKRSHESQVIKIWEIKAQGEDTVTLDAECKCVISGYLAPIWAVCFISASHYGHVTYLASGTGEDPNYLSTYQDHAVAIYSLPVKSDMIRIFVTFSPGLLHGNAAFTRVPVDVYTAGNVYDQIASVAQGLTAPIPFSNLSFRCRGRDLSSSFAFADGDAVDAAAVDMVGVNVLYPDHVTVFHFVFDPICTCADIKDHIFRRSGVAIDRQVLMLSDHVLKDEVAVAAGSTVSLSFSTRACDVDDAPPVNRGIFTTNWRHFTDAELYPWRTREFAAHFFDNLLCNRNPHSFLLHSPIATPHLMANILEKLVDGGFVVPESFFLPDRRNSLFQISKVLRSFKSIQEATSVINIWIEGIFDHDDPLGRFFIVEGGWSPPHEVGHRVIYVIERVDDGTFSFSVCNSGQGLEFHPPDSSSKPFVFSKSILNISKTNFPRRISSITVRDISKTKIQSTFLWESLKTIQSSSENNLLLKSSSPSIEPHHIFYRFLLPFLSDSAASLAFPDSISTSIAYSDSGYPQKSQTGNTCFHRAWLCALQFLMKRLGFSLFECKQVSCFSRLRWLLDILEGIERSANQLQMNASDAHLIEMANLNTRRAVAKLYQRCSAERIHHDLAFKFLQFAEEICENVAKVLQSARSVTATPDRIPCVQHDLGTFEAVTSVFGLPAPSLPLSGCEFNCLNLLFLSEASMDKPECSASQLFRMELEAPAVIPVLPAAGVEDQFKNIEHIIRIGNNDCEKLLCSTLISPYNKCMQSFAILEHVFIVQLSPQRWKRLLDRNEPVDSISDRLRMSLLAAIEAAATIYVMIRIYLLSQSPSDRFSMDLSDDKHFINLCFMNVWFRNVLQRKDSRSCPAAKILMRRNTRDGANESILGLVKCFSAEQSHACALVIEMMQTTSFYELVSVIKYSDSELFRFNRGDPWYCLIEEILKSKNIQGFDGQDDVARIFTLEPDQFRHACPEVYVFRNMHILFMLVMRNARLPESSFFDWKQFFLKSKNSDNCWSGFTCDLVDQRTPGSYCFRIGGVTFTDEAQFRIVDKNWKMSFALSFLYTDRLPSHPSDLSPLAFDILQSSFSAPLLAIPLVLKRFRQLSNIFKSSDPHVRKSLFLSLFRQGFRRDPQLHIDTWIPLPTDLMSTSFGIMMFHTQYSPVMLLSDVVSVCASLHLHVSSESCTTYESIAALQTIVQVSVAVLRMLPSEIDKSQLMSHVSFFSDTLFQRALEAESLNEKLLLFSRSALGYSVFQLCHPDSHRFLEAFLQASSYVMFWFERVSAAESDDVVAAISDVFREHVAIRTELPNAIDRIEGHQLSHLLNGITFNLKVKLRGEWLVLPGSKLCFCNGDVLINLQTLQISCPIEQVPSCFSNSQIVNEAISEKLNFNCVVDRFERSKVYHVKDVSQRAYLIQASTFMKNDEFIKSHLSHFVNVEPGKENVLFGIADKVLMQFWSFLYPCVESNNIFVQKRDESNVVYLAKHITGCWLEITMTSRDFLPTLVQVFEISVVNSASALSRVLIFSSDRRFSYQKNPLDFPKGLCGLPRANKDMLIPDLLLSELYPQLPYSNEAISVFRDGAAGREVFISNDNLKGLLPLCLLRRGQIKFWLHVDSQVITSESETECASIKIIRDQSTGIVKVHSVDNVSKDSFFLMNTASACLSPETCRLLRTLACIESMNYICCWAKSFDDVWPQRVHLPRLGITLYFCSKTQQFETLVEGKQLCLVEYAEASRIFTDLPGYLSAFLQCSLVLRNDVQDVFLLTSCAQLHCIRREESGYLFSSHTDAKKETDTVRYIVYPLNRFGLGLANLAPCSWKAHFAMFVHCIFRNYDEAIRIAMYEYSDILHCGKDDDCHKDDTVRRSRQLILKLQSGTNWKESDPRFIRLLGLIEPSPCPFSRVLKSFLERGVDNPSANAEEGEEEQSSVRASLSVVQFIGSILELEEGYILQIQESALRCECICSQDIVFNAILQMSPETFASFSTMVSKSLLSGRFSGSGVFEALHERFFAAARICKFDDDPSKSFLESLACDLFVAFCGNICVEPSLHLFVLAAFLIDTNAVSIMFGWNLHWQKLLPLSALYYLHHFQPRHSSDGSSETILRQFSDFCCGLEAPMDMRAEAHPDVLAADVLAGDPPALAPFAAATVTQVRQSDLSSCACDVVAQVSAGKLPPEECRTVCEWVHALLPPHPALFGSAVLQQWTSEPEEDDARKQMSAQRVSRISTWLRRCERCESIDVREYEGLQADLIWFKLREESRLRELLRRFLDSVNRFPKLDGSGICGNIDISCGNRLPFTFQELVSLLLYHPSCPLHHNSISDVSAAILSLLCAMGRTEYFAVTLESVLSAAAGKCEVVESMATLGQSLCAYRNIAHRTDFKQLLAFEFASGIAIRDDQLKMVDDMILQQAGGQRAIIHQAIMGCGKTSVICPYLALKLADEPLHDGHRRLVVVICPPALLLQTSQQLQAKLSTVFCKQIYVCTFDRNADSANVSSLLQMVTNALNTRSIICAGPSTVKSVLLKLIELEASTLDTSKKAALDLKRVLQIFRNGIAILDEVDLILHPLKSELTFSLGQRCGLSQKHRYLIPEFLVRATFGFELVELHGDQHSQLQSYFKDMHSTYASVFRDRELIDPKSYAVDFHGKGCLKQAYAHLLVCYLGFHFAISDHLKQTLFEFIFEKNDFKLTPADCVGDSECVAVARLCRVWCQELLPHILSKQHRVHYGLTSYDDTTSAVGEERFLKAVPFVGKELPSPDSEFSSIDVTFGFTALSFMKQQLRLRDVCGLVAHLQKHALSSDHMQAQKVFNMWRLWMGDSADGRDFWNLEVIDCQKTNVMAHLHAVVAQKQCFQLKQYYLLHIVYPATSSFSKESISADALDMCNMFSCVFGFSGTPTRNVYPVSWFVGGREFIPNMNYNDQERMERILSDSEHVGVEYMVQCSDCDKQWRVVSDESQSQKFESSWKVQDLLEAVASRTGVSCLIDCGALVTGLSNIEVAQFLMNLKNDDPRFEDFRQKFSVCVFWDSSDAPMALERGGSAAVQLSVCSKPAEEWFVYFDHVHTTGIDLSLPLTAVAVVTIGSDTVLRDYQQACWRLRQLGLGQRVLPVLVPEIHRLVVKFAAASDLSDDVSTLQAFGTLTLKGGLQPRNLFGFLKAKQDKAESRQLLCLRKRELHGVWRRRCFHGVTDSDATQSKLLARKLVRSHNEDGFAGHANDLQESDCAIDADELQQLQIIDTAIQCLLQGASSPRARSAQQHNWDALAVQQMQQQAQQQKEALRENPGIPFAKATVTRWRLGDALPLLVKVADFEGVKPVVQADMEQLKRQMAEEAQGVAGRVEAMQSALEHSGKEQEGLLLASLMKLPEQVDGKIGAVKGEVDVQGKSMIEVPKTLAAERKAADDERKQAQARLEGVSSDVDAVQAQSAKLAETVSGPCSSLLSQKAANSPRQVREVSKTFSFYPDFLYTSQTFAAAFDGAASGVRSKLPKAEVILEIKPRDASFARRIVLVTLAEAETLFRMLLMIPPELAELCTLHALDCHGYCSQLLPSVNTYSDACREYLFGAPLGIVPCWFKPPSPLCVATAFARLLNNELNFDIFQGACIAACIANTLQTWARQGLVPDAVAADYEEGTFRDIFFASFRTVSSLRPVLAVDPQRSRVLCLVASVCSDPILSLSKVQRWQSAALTCIHLARLLCCQKINSSSASGTQLVDAATLAQHFWNGAHEHVDEFGAHLDRTPSAHAIGTLLGADRQDCVSLSVIFDRLRPISVDLTLKGIADAFELVLQMNYTIALVRYLSDCEADAASLFANVPQENQWIKADDIEHLIAIGS